jgi:hypothetical protein
VRIARPLPMHAPFPLILLAHLLSDTVQGCGEGWGLGFSLLGQHGGRTGVFWLPFGYGALTHGLPSVAAAESGDSSDSDIDAPEPTEEEAMKLVPVEKEARGPPRTCCLDHDPQFLLLWVPPTYVYVYVHVCMYVYVRMCVWGWWRAPLGELW